MKVEIYFFDTKPNKHYIEEWLKKHDLNVEKYFISFYDYHFEMDILCYQFDDLITMRTLNNLNFVVEVAKHPIEKLLGNIDIKPYIENNVGKFIVEQE